MLQAQQVWGYEEKRKKTIQKKEEKKSVINPSTKFAGSCFQRLV